MKRTSRPKPAARPVTVLVGTRKGAFILRGDGSRRTWKISEPILLGNIVHHMVLDPRDGRTLLMASRTGHLGPTIFRSRDRGKTWKEAACPPAFPKVPEGEKGLVVDHTFWLTPGHGSEPGVWYAGTSPQGVFRSEERESVLVMPAMLEVAKQMTRPRDPDARARAIPELRSQLARRLDFDGVPIKPQRVFKEINEFFDPDKGSVAKIEQSLGVSTAK